MARLFGLAVQDFSELFEQPAADYDRRDRLFRLVGFREPLYKLQAKPAKRPVQVMWPATAPEQGHRPVQQVRVDRTYVSNHWFPT